MTDLNDRAYDVYLALIQANLTAAIDDSLSTSWRVGNPQHPVPPGAEECGRHLGHPALPQDGEQHGSLARTSPASTTKSC